LAFSRGQFQFQRGHSLLFAVDREGCALRFCLQCDHGPGRLQFDLQSLPFTEALDLDSPFDRQVTLMLETNDTAAGRDFYPLQWCLADRNTVDQDGHSGRSTGQIDQAR